MVVISGEYIASIPECLEKSLAQYVPSERCNILAGDLRNSAVGYVPILRIMRSGDEIDDTNIYFFFGKEKRSIEIMLGQSPNRFIALDIDKYGFSSDEMVKINPERIAIDLSVQAQIAYERLLQLDEIGICDLLETVGFVINHSMKYDINKLKDIWCEELDGNINWQDVENNYKPTGDEVMHGLCYDAGVAIRKLLHSLNMENRFAFNCSNTYGNSLPNHDTTVVFEKHSGNWAIINSKSPIRPYNLVPKEKLPELGNPFYRTGDNND